jgi:hypothetical protein
MQRRPSEKPVIDLYGAAVGPRLTVCAASTTCLRVSVADSIDAQAPSPKASARDSVLPAKRREPWWRISISCYLHLLLALDHVTDD